MIRLDNRGFTPYHAASFFKVLPGFSQCVAIIAER